ncbi:DM13 domain-containing protein [Vibrio diabolicus]|uniref:DM13 domain-containing protein n=1 Tax=Vibrio diabolicus TaxID=50719 RepID=UPI0022A86706|nr:DM13 domain-containing protein [Vibrio diabolicus]MCZ0921786.1 DM13 domain-containing protein [Vibrio diabolicus]
MTLKSIIKLTLSHLVAVAIGIAIGIYTLPILIAPPAPTDEQVSKRMQGAEYSAVVTRDLKDSDAFHWGEGEIHLSSQAITLVGKLAPGPDYKLYLSPKFVETEQAFNDLKSEMSLVGDVKTFNNFVVEVPQGISISEYNTVVVWCETFGEFITSAKYQ